MKKQIKIGSKVYVSDSLVPGFNSMVMAIDHKDDNIAYVNFPPEVYHESYAISKTKAADLGLNPENPYLAIGINDLTLI